MPKSSTAYSSVLDVAESPLRFSMKPTVAYW